MSTGTRAEFGVVDVTVEVEIEATAEVVWQALTTDIGEWWPRDFCVGDVERFHLEPKLGGRMYEDWGDGGGLIWAVVTGFCEIGPTWNEAMSFLCTLWPLRLWPMTVAVTR